MVSVVRLTLSATDWDEVLAQSADVVARYGDAPESLPAGKLAELLRDVMMVAMQRHHTWLTERGIHTVISPAEDSERTYVFQFNSLREARLFQRRFGGELMQPPVC